MAPLLYTYSGVAQRATSSGSATPSQCSTSPRRSNGAVVRIRVPDTSDAGWGMGVSPGIAGTYASCVKRTSHCRRKARRVGNPPLEQHEVRLRGLRRGVLADPEVTAAATAAAELPRTKRAHVPLPSCFGRGTGAQ